MDFGLARDQDVPGLTRTGDQPYSNLGLVERLNAQWLIHQGKSPGNYFDAARKMYLKSIECNKEEPEGYRSMAEVYR